jgi:hypothetical protein
MLAQGLAAAYTTRGFETGRTTQLLGCAIVHNATANYYFESQMVSTHLTILFIRLFSAAPYTREVNQKY